MSILILGMPLTAQVLQNPSFENAQGQGDLSYWNHDCLAESSVGGAPGSGSWCARVEATNPQGCMVAWLYQVVPWAYDNMPFFLGGWCRNVPGFFGPGIRVDIGIMDDTGTITPLGLLPAQTDTNWFWMSAIDTLDLNSGDQAVVICDPGFVGGPAFALSEFDGLQFYEVFPTDIAEVTALNLPWRYDAELGAFNISLGDISLRDVQAFDAQGRKLPMSFSLCSDQLFIKLPTASSGLIVCRVITEKGNAVIRIVKALKGY
ncbi:MAG: hypothetical protein M3R08_03945 [Bacteroidota bacterium]|nr:hypothetical protein [Bacteroidota bacterium]